MQEYIKTGTMESGYETVWLTDFSHEVHMTAKLLQ